MSTERPAYLLLPQDRVTATSPTVDSALGERLDMSLDARIDAPLDTDALASHDIRAMLTTPAGDLRARLAGGGALAPGGEAAEDEGAAGDEATDPEPEGAEPGGVPARERRGARRGGRGSDGARGDKGVVVPAVEQGGHALTRSPMALPVAAVPFTARRELGIVSQTKETQPDPDIGRHASVFATATAAAAALHARLVANARTVGDDARRSAERRADRRQSSLDNDLFRLTTGLEEARSALNSAATSAVTLLDQHAGAARAAISAAAEKARGSIKTTHTKVSTSKKTQQESATTVDNNAAAAVFAIMDAGTSAETSLEALANRPEERFGAGGGPMQSAQNERIALRISPRAKAQKTVMHEAADAQSKAMEPMITQLRTDLTAAFMVFDGWLSDLDTKAPEAVNNAETEAVNKLRTNTRQLTKAIEAGRVQTEAALVAQHNAARLQLIDSATKRATQEEELAEQRATADVSTAISLAGSPASTVEAVRDSLEQERRRPADEFAKVVVKSALAMTPRLDGAVAPQQQRLNQRARDALNQLDTQSDESGARLYSSVLETADRLIDAATRTGEALTAQADGAGPGLTRLARPVAQSTSKMIEQIDTNFAIVLDKMTADIKAAGEHLTASLDGKGGKGGGETPPPVTTPGPDETPNGFKARATGITAAPETETVLTAFVKTARGKVDIDIRSRASGINTELGSFIHSEENIFANLRQMLPRQARGLRFWFNTNHTPTLSGRLKFYFDSSLTTNETWRRNWNAAEAYLAGNASEGALQEMAASVVLWNDTDRLERVQRSLTPAQMMKLQTLTDAPAILADVRGDIDGLDQQVFDALNTVTEDNTSGVGTANALRMGASIDKARETRGYEGGEATYNAIRDANRAAGSNLLSGADALDLDTDDERRARRERNWTETLDAFARQHPLPENYEGPRDAREALIAYASGERTYTIEHGHGEHSHTEYVRERVGTDHERLIGNLVRSGEGSAATRAALMVVQMRRPGARPDANRFDEATYDADLNPELASTDPDRMTRRDEARERRREMFRLYDLYMRGEAAVAAEPRSPEAIQADLAETVGTRLASDENRAAYVRSMITEERGDPVAAFTFAVNDWGTNTEVLRRTFGRMTREQVDQAVTDYANAHNGESLYARLGIHGEGTWLGSELSGEERQQITVASMGVAQNDRQRAEVAAMEARLQRNEAGWAGRWLAGDEYARLSRDYDNLLATMGVSDTDREGRGRTNFDSRGRLILQTENGTRIDVGHFTRDGRFEPPAGMPPEALEVAMGQAGISQRAYVAATDRIANAITTTLVVTAAIVTTALTGGAAASIWIPVLVTAGAGLAGMAASSAIKGGRYGRDEMLRDLGTTIVQAATAGLGAAAGVALRGGAPALRAVGSRMMVSEKALERFMAMGGRGGLRQALTMSEEALVAGGTAGFGGMGQAALDADAWHADRWGEGIVHAGFRGFLGGTLGSVVMRPVMRAGLPEGGPEALGRHVVRRGLGSAVSGTTSRAVEIGYDTGRGQRMETGQIESELQMAFLQNLVQGMGEGGAERGSDRIRAIRSEARRAARQAPLPGATARTTPPEIEARTPTRSGSETEAPVPTRVLPEADPRPSHPALPPEVEPVPVPPALRETVPEIADAVAGPLRPVADEMRVVAATAPVDTAAPPAAQTMLPPSPPRKRPPPIPKDALRDDSDTTLRIVRPADPTAQGATPPPTRKPARPPPIPVSANDNDPDATIRIRRAPDAADPDATQPGRNKTVEVEPLEGMAVMMDPDPRSQSAANENYTAMIRDDPRREAGVYYNPVTGEFIVVQGLTGTVAVAMPKPNTFEGPAPGGMPQAWKEILDYDLGHWRLIAHYHPPDPATGKSPLLRRLPSGVGADFGTVEYASAWAAGAPRMSRIHFMHKGVMMHTDFGFNPASTTARYWIEYPRPFWGIRRRVEFPTMEAYAKFVERETGLPKQFVLQPPGAHTPQGQTTTGGQATTGGPSAPAGIFDTVRRWLSPGEAPGNPRITSPPEAEVPTTAPRPDQNAPVLPDVEQALYHGTADIDLRSMLASGIQLARSEHARQDFGGAFYLAFDIGTGNLYASDKARSHNDRMTARGEQGPPAVGAVLEFRLRMSDLEPIVDVRPGGRDRQRWEEFLNRNPPAFAPRGPYGDSPWDTTLDYLMRGGGEQRGEAFKAFLEEINMGHAKAVWGDLGGVATSGRVSAAGTEQLAIRDQELLDRLTAQLRVGMLETGGAIPMPVSPRSLDDPDNPPAGAPRVPGSEQVEPTAARPAIGEESPPTAARPEAEQTAPPRPETAEIAETAPARPTTEEPEAARPSPQLQASEAAPAGRRGRRGAPRMQAAGEETATPRARGRGKAAVKAGAPPQEEAGTPGVAAEPKKKAASRRRAQAPTEAAPAGTEARAKKAQRRRPPALKPDESPPQPVRRDQPIEPTREGIEGAVLRNLAELQRIVQEAAQQALSDPEVVQGLARARAREAATIEARNAARDLPDSEIPQMLLEVGAGFLAAALLIRQTALPTGMTGDNSVLFTRFVIGLALGNERQFVRGPGGRFLGQGRIPGQTRDRRLNYDILVAELRHYRGANGEPLGGREFVGILRDFAQTGLARPPFHGAEGAAALGEFARLIFSVEVARSTNFAVEGPQILHLMETTDLSLEDAFMRSSALNPMSMRKAVAANRRYEESVAGDPAAHAALMARTLRDVARKRTAGTELTAFEQVVTRRQELLVQSIMTELGQQRHTFANDEAFLTWVREELRRRLLERTRRLFGNNPAAAPRTYPGLFGPLPIGQG